MVRIARERGGRVSVASTDVPDAVQAIALHRHKADLARLRRLRDIVHAHACSKLKLLFAKGIGKGLAVVLRFVDVDVLRIDIYRVDDQQEIAIGLQVKRPCIGRRGQEVDWSWVPGIGDIENGDAVAEPRPPWSE